MRHYSVSCTDHGGHSVPTTPEYVTSRAKASVVASILFRKIFGRIPDRQFIRDRGMAWARDRRGNSVLIEQINFDEMPGFDTATKTFPLTKTQS